MCPPIRGISTGLCWHSRIFSLPSSRRPRAAALPTPALPRTSRRRRLRACGWGPITFSASTVPGKPRQSILSVPSRAQRTACRQRWMWSSTAIKRTTRRSGRQCSGSLTRCCPGWRNIMAFGRCCTRPKRPMTGIWRRTMPTIRSGSAALPDSLHCPTDARGPSGSIPAACGCPATPGGSHISI